MYIIRIFQAIKRSQEYHDPTQSANQGIVNNGSSEKLITTEGKGLREEEETEKEEEEKWEEEEVHKVFREAIGSAVVTTEQNEMSEFVCLPIYLSLCIPFLLHPSL